MLPCRNHTVSSHGIMDFSKKNMYCMVFPYPTGHSHPSVSEHVRTNPLCVSRLSAFGNTRLIPPHSVPSTSDEDEWRGRGASCAPPAAFAGVPPSATGAFGSSPRPPPGETASGDGAPHGKRKAGRTTPSWDKRCSHQL